MRKNARISLDVSKGLDSSSANFKLLSRHTCEVKTECRYRRVLVLKHSLTVHLKSYGTESQSLSNNPKSILHLLLLVL